MQRSCLLVAIRRDEFVDGKGFPAAAVDQGQQLVRLSKLARLVQACPTPPSPPAATTGSRTACH